jgi:hypothetical protein
MDTFSGFNNASDSVNTGIRTTSNKMKAGIVALGIILSSNQMLVDTANVTSNTSMLTRIDGSFSTRGVYSNIYRHNYADRYRAITKSEWFQSAYKNKSLGEIVGIDA